MRSGDQMGGRLSVLAALVAGCMLLAAVPADAALLKLRAPQTIVGVGTLVALSCPSVTLCLAVDDAGKVVRSTRPRGGAATWHVIHGLRVTTDSGANSILSCPSVSLCVALDDGGVAATVHPRGAAGTWKFSQVGRSEVISCPSVHLCIDMAGYTLGPGNGAGGHPGRILVSRNPAYGGWRTVARSFDMRVLRALACPSVSLCVVIGDDGIESSTHPTHGSSWHSTAHAAPRGDVFSHLACPDPLFCLASDDDLHLWRSTRPAIGPWRRVQLPRPLGATGALACAPGRMCVAASGNVLLESDHPTRGHATWQVIKWKTAIYRDLFALACPNRDLCIGVGRDGLLLTGVRRSD